MINDLYKCVVCVYLPRLKLTLYLWLCHGLWLDAVKYHLASAEYVNLCLHICSFLNDVVEKASPRYLNDVRLTQTIINFNHFAAVSG